MRLVVHNAELNVTWCGTLQMAETRRGAPKFAKAAFQESQVNIPQPVAQIAATLDELLPEKGPPRTTPEWLSKAAKAASVSPLSAT